MFEQGMVWQMVDLSMRWEPCSPNAYILSIPHPENCDSCGLCSTRPNSSLRLWPCIAVDTTLPHPLVHGE